MSNPTGKNRHDFSPLAPHPNSKLSAPVIDAIASCVAKGNYLVTAANAIGVNPETISRWLNSADADSSAGLGPNDSLYIKLAQAIRKAEAEAEQALASVVRSAAIDKREWLPAITFLERRWRDRWGRPAPFNATINDNRQVTITHVEYNMAGSDRALIEGTAKELPAIAEDNSE